MGGGSASPNESRGARSGEFSAPETHYIDRILPRPRQVHYGEFILLKPERDGRIAVTIVSGEGASELDHMAAAQIEARLRRLQIGPRMIDVTHVELEPNSSLPRAALTIHIGRPDDHSHILRHLQQHALKPPEEMEGYLIATSQRGAPSIYIAGHDARGTFYGVQSLLQMMTVRDRLPAVRALQISDWPAYRIRGSGNDEFIPPAAVARETVTQFSHVKLNSWAVGQSYYWPENWRETPPESLEALRQAGQIARSGMLDILFQMHPFGRANDPTQHHTINISNKADRSLLIRLCLDQLAAGSRHILLRADDFHELSPPDKIHYPDKAEAHAELIHELHEQMARQFPDARLFFCPPYYAGKAALGDAGAAAYLQTLGEAIAGDVQLIWTGPEVVSPSFNRGDLEAFAGLVGRSPLLWDNTVLREQSSFGYPYLYAWHMFHPFETEHPFGHHLLAPGIRFNHGFDGSQKGRVANVVLADYLWNPFAYDPEESLRAAIGLIAGPQAIGAVLDLAEELQYLFDLRHSPARAFAPRPPPTPERYQRLLRGLAERTDNQDLVEEFQEGWWGQAETARQLTAVAARLASHRADSLAIFSLEEGEWESSTHGQWSVKFFSELVTFSFPFETPSFGGAYAEVSRLIRVPESPTGRYLLAFLADDSSYADGSPPNAWPGFFHKQVLLDDEVIWEDDAVGMESPGVMEVDVTDQLKGRSEAILRLRGYDAGGVTNLGVRISFSPVVLTAGRE